MLQANSRSVNVKRLELLEKLKVNRDAHKKQYAEAFLGFRIEVQKVLSEALLKATNNEYDEGLYITEQPPEDHTPEYDQIIQMMEMSVDEYINLDSSSFNQFVLDNWSWKQSFAGTAAKYASNVR